MARYLGCLNSRVSPDPLSNINGSHASSEMFVCEGQNSSTAVLDLPVDLEKYAELHSIHSSIIETTTNSNFLVHSKSNETDARETKMTARIRRSLFHVWNNKLTLRLFGTRKKILEEKQRQENISHWVIHPLSKFRLIWDAVMFVILALNVIFLPVAIAFFDDSINYSWMTFNILLDSLFITDILLNFWTGILTSDNTVYLDLFKIRCYYLKTWFLVDVLAVLPFDYIELIVNTFHSMQSSRALRMIRLLRLLSLLKLLRVTRFMRYLSKGEEFINTTKSLVRIFNLILLMIMFAHWNGCIQFLISYIQDFPHNSWVIINNLKDKSVFVRYTWSVFKSTSHMLCIGYGRFPPQNAVEVWITITSMLIGASFYAVFIGYISNLIHSVDSSSRQYNERIKQVEEYMRYRRLPCKLQDQVHEYFYHKYHGQLFDEEKILNELSHPLKERIVMHNCQNLVKIVPFFQDASEAFINCVVTRLKFEVFLPGDYIIRQGTFGSKMYFIQQGTVNILLPNKRITATLSDGAYFGEICLLMKCRRIGDVKAVSICDLYGLSNDDFQHVLDQFPDMRIKLEGVASQRLATMMSSSREAMHSISYSLHTDLQAASQPIQRKTSITALSTAAANVQ